MAVVVVVVFFGGRCQTYERCELLFSHPRVELTTGQLLLIIVVGFVMI